MINSLAAVLPVMIYFLLIILLVVVIVLGIKIIITVDTINKIMADVQGKIASLDSIFKLADLATNKFSHLGTIVIDGIMKAFGKIFGMKSGKDEEDYV